MLGRDTAISPASGRRVVSPPPKTMTQRKANSGQRLKPIASPQRARSSSDDLGVVALAEPPVALAPTSSRAAVLSGGPVGGDSSSTVALWPARRASPRDAPNQTHSRAPLTLQLEAFIRKEHRNYVMEHPDCSRLDTLFIFKEAFATFVDHFPEYRSVLYVIREAYDAAIAEMTEQVARMRTADLATKSDRSLHAMELMHLKENLNATISNQQAQLAAAQGLVHGLREQLAAAEHANSLMKIEMEKKFREHDEAQEKVRLFSKTIIEENARTAAIIDASKAKDKDLELQKAQIQVLRERVTELEACVKEQTLRRLVGDGGSDGSGSPTSAAGSSATTAAALAERGNRQQEAAKDSTDTGFRPEYVELLVKRLDAAELELSRCAAARELETVAVAASEALPPSVGGTNGASSSAEVAFPVIRQWLRLEGVAEEDLLATDYLLPAGLCESEETAFLQLCAPVFNRHLTQRDALALLDQFWLSRAREVNHTPLRAFLVSWAAKQCGGDAPGRELAANMMAACAACVTHPECRAFLCTLRGFLPEQMVLTWRAAVEQLQSFLTSSPDVVGGSVPVPALMEKVRALFPGKPLSDMRQLHFCVYRACGSLEAAPVAAISGAHCFFMTVLKTQFFREVEEMTLSVVETIRACGDASHGTVRLIKAMDAVQQRHSDLSLRELHTIFADGCQKTLRDVAVADSNVTVRLAPLLARLRSSVLIRHAAPAVVP